MMNTKHRETAEAFAAVARVDLDVIPARPLPRVQIQDNGADSPRALRLLAAALMCVTLVSVCWAAHSVQQRKHASVTLEEAVKRIRAGMRPHEIQDDVAIATRRITEAISALRATRRIMDSIDVDEALRIIQEAAADE